MKRILLPLAFLAGTFVATAQVTLGTESISATGQYYSGAWGSLSVNIGGEPVIETISGGGNFVTQGFEQPKFKGVGIVNLPANAPAVNLYPNPSSDMVNVAFNLTHPGKLSLRLFDIAGRELNGSSKTVMQGQQLETLDFINLSQGVYMLNIVFDAADNTKSFSIVKRVEIVR